MPIALTFPPARISCFGRRVWLGLVITCGPAAGQTQFAEAPGLPTNGSSVVFGGALGDVDNDGDLDQVWCVPGATRMLLNDGRGQFTDVSQTQLYPSTLGGIAAAFVDLDADGDQDLVTINPDHIYINDGHGVFTLSPVDLGSSLGVSLAVGDVDGDGDEDLIVGNIGQNELFLNDGSGALALDTAGLPVVDDNSWSVVLGDVDGDGDLDLVVGNKTWPARPPSRLCVNDGQGRFSDAPFTQFPADPTGQVAAAALADLDGDHDLDVLLVAGGVQQSMLINDGGGQFIVADSARLPAFPIPLGSIQSLALGDVDLDGDLDCVLGTGGQCGLWGCADAYDLLWLNDGGGFFADTSMSRLRTIRTTRTVMLGDLDGDSDLDVMALGRSGPQLFTNRHRQLDTPQHANIGAQVSIDGYAEPGYGSAGFVTIPLLSRAEAYRVLAPHGTLRIDLAQGIRLTPAPVMPSLGRSTTRFTIPNDPSLAGRTIFVQAAIIDPMGAIRLTNSTAIMIH